MCEWNKLQWFDKGSDSFGIFVRANYGFEINIISTTAIKQW
jgi:hypothetical protein